MIQSIVTQRVRNILNLRGGLSPVYYEQKMYLMQLITVVITQVVQS